MFFFFEFIFNPDSIEIRISYFIGPDPRCRPDRPSTSCRRRTSRRNWPIPAGLLWCSGSPLCICSYGKRYFINVVDFTFYFTNLFIMYAFTLIELLIANFNFFFNEELASFQKKMITFLNRNTYIDSFSLRKFRVTKLIMLE